MREKGVDDCGCFEHGSIFVVFARAANEANETYQWVVVVIEGNK